MKTVVLVLKQSYNNSNESFYKETSWGIGDMLRGVYGTHTLAKHIGFRLIVDFSLHPIRDFLQMKEHEYSAMVHEKKDTIPYIDGIFNFYSVSSYVQNRLAESDILLMFTTFGLYTYDSPPATDTMEFVRSLLIPTPSFQEYIDAHSVPYSSYSILHYRLGDAELVDGVQSDNLAVVEHVCRNIGETDILICDSVSMKQAVLKRNANIFMFNEPICHVGTSTDVDALRHTLFELLLLTKATKIRSFSCYIWVSGFVTAISKIYNIPLEGHTNFRG